MTLNLKTRIGSELRRASVRVISVIAGLLVSVFAAYSAVQIGFARGLSERALKTHSVETASEAVRKSNKDPESYRVRSLAQAHRGEFDQAVADLQQAISLRPADYQLWRQLGRVLAGKGDTAAALVAFTEAQRLAPSYGSTCWDLGVLLVKLGQLEEGFKQLRNATLRNPELLPEVMELAWTKYEGQAVPFQLALAPRKNEEQLWLVHFLIRKAKPDERLDVVALTENVSTAQRGQVIRELVATKRFAEAYQLWQKDSGTSKQGEGTLEDGGFESGQLRDEAVFGWKVNHGAATPSVSIDRSDPHSGAASLRLEWAGNPAPSEEPVSQLLLVDPDTRYELRFVVRAQHLITGGAPVVQITDVNGSDRSLARSQKLPLGDSEWENVRVEFTTGKLTRAIRIGIQREPCHPLSCPVFGTLMLDDFSVQRQET